MTTRERIHYFVLFGVVVGQIILLIWQWQTTNIEQEILTALTNSATQSSLDMRLNRWRKKPAAQVVKGVYLTAYSAANSKKLEQIIDLVNRTELNSVVIDIKDYSGYVLYNSNVSLVDDLKLEDVRIKDVRPIIDELHKHKIYVVARQTVFQDPVLAEKRPEWAIHRTDGSVWRDRKNLAWVDPTRREVWDYNIAIAREAIRLGFDEINFDYVRFPSDGNMAAIAYTTGNKKKYEVMGEFYSYLGEQLKTEPAWLSLDMFGFVMEKTGEDDMNIGQRLVDAVDVVDYICPMMYPSHYPAGHLGLANPAAHPALVIKNGMEKGAPVFIEKRAKLRPWLQAFDIGATYDGEKIRAQISEVEAYGADGWLLWNASNKYTLQGLKMVDDLSLK